MVRWRWTVPLLAVALRSVAAKDILDEIGGEWKMGLRPRQDDSNLQSFTGALGGASAPAITKSDDPERPYEVEGDTFPDFESAANRACDNQKNSCAEQANSGGDFEVGDCDEQSNECKESISSATATSFNALVSSDAEFDYFCDV